jgi:hypothetical protein
MGGPTPPLPLYATDEFYEGDNVMFDSYSFAVPTAGSVLHVQRSALSHPDNLHVSETSQSPAFYAIKGSLGPILRHESTSRPPFKVPLQYYLSPTPKYSRNSLSFS